MIVRLVKMTFRPGTENEFIEVFNRSCNAIRASRGCRELQLLRGKTEPHVFFTYSVWDDESDLDNYRKSELFRSTWAATRALFGDRPEVISTEKIFGA